MALILLFFLEFWYLIKDEVRIMFDQFDANAKLPKSMMSFFVVLIPKVASLLELKDYRPIIMLGSLSFLLRCWLEDWRG